MKSNRVVTVGLLILACGIGSLVVVSPLIMQRPHGDTSSVRDREEPAQPSAASRDTEAFLERAGSLSKQEKQLFREGNMRERAALAALSSVRDWNTAVSQDASASEAERAEAARALERIEGVVREIQESRTAVEQ